MTRCFRYTNVCHAEATVEKKYSGRYVPACRRCAADIDALKAVPAPTPTQDAAPPASPPPPPSRWKLRPDADARPGMCRVDGCHRKVQRRGACAVHLPELHVAGDTTILLPSLTPSEVARMGQAAWKAKRAAKCAELVG